MECKLSPCGIARLQAIIAAGTVAVAVCLGGCQSTGPNRALGTAFGGMAGGLTGAAIGTQEGKAPEGALFGALTGMAAGSAVGGALDNQVERDRMDAQQAANEANLNAISFEQVIQMTRSGLSDDIVASQIYNQGVVRKPTFGDLMMLKNNGVSDATIYALQNAPVAGAGALVATHRIPATTVYYEEPSVFYYPTPHHWCHPYHRPFGSRHRHGSHVGFSFGF
jgi:hypothetical protein